MRKLVVTLSLAAAGLIYAASVNAQPYYNDGYWIWWLNGFGPYYDCSGHRCYIGPPYSYRRHRGPNYYGPRQYYYGPNGGYARDCSYWTISERRLSLDAVRGPALSEQLMWLSLDR